MPKNRSERPLATPALRVGDPFNPFGVFNGVFIPEVLVRSKLISPGAKLAYGRLARYAGPDGRCFPALPTLAAEIGVGVRQAQRYLSELDKNEFVQRIPSMSARGQESNEYVFLWHRIFVGAVTRRSPRGVTDPSPEGVTHTSPKDNQSEENHDEENNIDLDPPPSNRKKRDSSADTGDVGSSSKTYPRLKEALAEYMVSANDRERVYPPARLVVDVMAAADGATEGEVIECLRYLREERGLKPGTRHGPRSFAWFKTVVGDYFTQRNFKRMVYEPPGDPAAVPPLSKAEFDSMTDAIEI
jgi:hypothetical protein